MSGRQTCNSDSFTNVAEDHQTRNAEALSVRNAAMLIKITRQKFIVEEAVKLISDKTRRDRFLKTSGNWRQER